MKVELKENANIDSLKPGDTFEHEGYVYLVLDARNSTGDRTAASLSTGSVEPFSKGTFVTVKNLVAVEK